VVHALAHAMNERLNNVGQTVRYVQAAEPHEDTSLESLRKLVEAMNAGQVDVLVILGGNPVFTAPGDLDFRSALEKVRLRIHHSLCYDETSYHCHWHIPEPHYLESWGDIRAYDGAVGIMQPLIAPLYRSKTAYQLIAALLGEDDPGGIGPIVNYWRGRLGIDTSPLTIPRTQPTTSPTAGTTRPAGDERFDAFWYESLRRGVVKGYGLAPADVHVDLAFLSRSRPPGATPEGLEISFRPDPSIWDGRFANNAWLQELPKPLTKLTWDNAALISPKTAADLHLEKEQMVKLRLGGRELTMPVWITPGQADGQITVYVGHGRTQSGRVGTAVPGESGGFNAYAIRASDAMWFAGGLQIEPTNKFYRLACTRIIR